MTQPYSGTQVRQNFFSNRVITDWNQLPAEHQQCPLRLFAALKDRLKLITFKDWEQKPTSNMYVRSKSNSTAVKRLTIITATNKKNLG